MGVPSAIGREGLFTQRDFAGAPSGGAPSEQVAASWRSTLLLDRDQLTAQIGKALRDLPDKGDTAVPSDLASVALLLDPPPDLSDLDALDALQSAFPRNTKLSHNRVVLAIARSVTRGFGTETRLPLTAAKAWAMLDSTFFSDELAEQFDQIAKFILGWQSDKKDFLLLDPSEIGLIEYIFEQLHPRRQGILVAKAMDFKALSLRRLGLLRRIPMRVDQMLRNGEANGNLETAVTYAKDCLALLDHIARPGGFQPIIDEAKVSAAKIVKAVQRATTPPALAAPPGAVGQPQIAAPQSQPAPAPPVQAPAIQPPAAQADGGAEASEPAPRPLPPTPPTRLSKRHRTDAVIRVLRGEDMNDIAHALGVKPSAVESWTEAFISGGATALSTRSKGMDKTETPPPAPEPARASSDTETVEDLKRRVEQLTQMMEQLAKSGKKE